MKPEWGHKHECSKCGAHFYDMRKPNACCPKCQTPVNDAATLRAKTAKASKDVVPPKKKKVEGEDLLEDFDDFDDLDDDLVLDDDDDDFLEDTEELGDDDSDMSEIIEHMDDSESDRNL